MSKKGIKPGLAILLVILGLALIIGVTFISYHNKFVRADETINQQWDPVSAPGRPDPQPG